MWIEPKPFPYLKPSQYASFGDGKIIFTDKGIPEDKKEWLQKEFKKWWDEREKAIAEEGEKYERGV